MGRKPPRLYERKQMEIDPAHISKVKNAKFLGVIPHPDLNQPVYTFYQKEKHPRGSNFFGLYWRKTSDFETRLMVIDAGYVVGTEYWGILRPDNTVLYSSFRHDFVEDEHGNMVDGGNDYMKYRLMRGSRLVKFKFKKNGVLMVCVEE